MMFERISRRVTRRAERRVAERVAELTERMRAELPRGIEAEAVPEGVRLSGRRVRRRFALEAVLRWIL